MNPWVYTLPRGEDTDEFDVDSLEYKYLDNFIEENNHPGRMEDGQVCDHCTNASSYCKSNSVVLIYSCILTHKESLSLSNLTRYKTYPDHL